MIPKRLAWELYIESIMHDGESSLPYDETAIADARKRAEALLLEHGLAMPPANPQASRQRGEFAAEFTPIATLAAADIVKATAKFEGGVLKLLASTLRADLAIAVELHPEQAEKFADCIFFLHFEKLGLPIAVFPGESPVFSRLFSDDLISGLNVRVTWVLLQAVDGAYLESLKISRRNLRDPGSRKLYNALIEQAEKD